MIPVAYLPLVLFLVWCALGVLSVALFEVHMWQRDFMGTGRTRFALFKHYLRDYYWAQPRLTALPMVVFGPFSLFGVVCLILTSGRIRRR